MVETREPFIIFSTPGPVEEENGRAALVFESGVQPESAQHKSEWTSTHWKDSHEHCVALK